MTAPQNASTPTKKPLTGLGLAEIGDLASFLNASAPSAAPTSGPLQLDLALIDEDPQQPRLFFDPESLAELAETIRARGVKTPISVRENPDQPGRYLINHGARRFRASRLADRTTIPAFIDSDYNAADQVIENLQRDALTPREIADFIGREIARGRKQSEIARAIGKSPAFVTQHVTLLDLPEPIALIFNTDRCRDVTMINELVTAYKTHPAIVTEWLSDPTQELTRSAVKLLRAFLDNKRLTPRNENRAVDLAGRVLAAVGPHHNPPAAAPLPETSGRLRRAILRVDYNGRPGQLLLHRRPPAAGAAWVRFDDDGREAGVMLATLRLVALEEEGDPAVAPLSATTHAATSATPVPA
jgi:ParB family chromosome partitioning protein